MTTSISNREDSKRIKDCRELYLKYNGKHHDLIEKEMRELGHHRFSRRSLHPRFERNRVKDGLIGKYGFNHLLNVQRRKFEGQSDHIGTIETIVTKDEVATPTVAEPQPTDTTVAFDQQADFDNFLAWLQTVSPEMTWTWKHQVYIYKRLRRITEGKTKRLMIFLPPRHGKSELVTVRYAAWRLLQDPKMNVILGSYNQRLANRFSRKIKKVLMDDAAITMAKNNPQWQQAAENSIDRAQPDFSRDCQRQPQKSQPSAPQQFPAVPTSMFPFVRGRQINTDAEWETAVGGGLRAVGVGSGITGFGANLIVVDDPIKSRAEAESPKIREKVWNWFNDDLYTRLEKDAAMVLIQTRWHEDDLAGRLLRQMENGEGDRWEVVNLPALSEPRASATGLSSSDQDLVSTQSRQDAEPQREDTVGLDDDRQPGEALCPERFDVTALNNIKKHIGSYSFASLYQQHPVPAEGGLFKRAWFVDKIIPMAPTGLKWARGTDPGISSADNADYTASFRVAKDKDGNMYIDGGFRKQIEYPNLRRFILKCLNNERDTVHGIELSANGNALVQDLRREPNVQGRTLRGIKVTDSKVARALPWNALAESGNLFLVRGAWNKDFIEEVCSFPTGTHDDQIDAVSIAFQMSTERNKVLYRF